MFLAFCLMVVFESLMRRLRFGNLGPLSPVKPPAELTGSRVGLETSQELMDGDPGALLGALPEA